MDNERNNWNKEEAADAVSNTPPCTESGTPWAEENQNQTTGDGLWAHAGKRLQERERLEEYGSRIWPERGTGQSQTDGSAGQSPYRGQIPPRYTGVQQNRQNDSRKQYEIQYKAEYNKKPKDGLGIAALVLGILSLICCLFNFIGISFGVLGILFAIMSKTDEPIQGYAKAGLIISIAAISLNVIFIILVAF